MLPYVEFIRPVLGMADVHWDREMSCRTSRWTWTFNFANLQFDALFWSMAYAAVECPLWHHIGHKFFLRCVTDKT